ncbi:MAG TPA: hypothetical protein VMV00_02000 [Candidatus Baltobacteraceae bacterium]|nr:hypothetical protein [Candidatus Baltobacteraceae bacterium]
MAQRILLGMVKAFDITASMAALQLDDEVAVGDHIRVEKDGKGFEQKVADLRLQNINVRRGFSGNAVQIKLDMPVEEGSSVYKMV